MKSLFILFLFSVSPFALAIDVGDGSDGACTQATFVAGKRTYQCSTLTISGPVNIFKAQSGSALLIKVQSTVSITAAGSIDVSGGAGSNGSNASAVSGGLGGPGAGNGGNSQFLVPPRGIGNTSGDGLSGTGSGAGTGGLFVDDDVAQTGSTGGGGGGGSLLTKNVTEPTDGDTPTNSPALNTKGANGNNPLTSEAQFDSTFIGGAGGGAGGGGSQVGTRATLSGGSGGGGGGAIRIVSGGNIIIDGNITANGGAGGGDGTTDIAGGGGGAGGIIWIQAAGTLTVTSTLSAIGGVQGTTLLGAGDGGAGGNGGIRLDSGGALDTTLATTNPPHYHTTFSPTSATSPMTTRQYSSSISCAKVSLENDQKNFVINSIVGFIIAAAIHFASSKRKA